MTRKISGAVELISRMLTGKVPALPRIGFSVVDVRDLAALHIKAMRDSKAAGQRFLGMGDFLWMEDRAKLRTNLMGLRLPPKFGVRQSPAIVVSQVKRMRLRRTYLENERIGDSACGDHRCGHRRFAESGTRKHITDCLPSYGNGRLTKPSMQERSDKANTRASLG